MHKIREIREYPPIHVLFSRWKEEKDIVFLDSSLENRLGRYSIIGRLPYQKLVQDGDSFCVNDEKQKMTFENYLRTYLKEHPDSNESDLPIVSGAMGYISYDYGREKENVAARHPKEVDMPDLILCFYDNFIIEDHQEKRFYLVANGQTKEVDTLLDDVENTVAETYTLWKNGQIPGTKDDHSKIRVTPNFTKEDYKQAVQDMNNLWVGVGDLYVTVYGGRTRLVGILLGRGLDIDEAKAELNGVTLESLVVAVRVARAVRIRAQKGELKLSDFPMLMHVDDILSHHAPVNIPWEQFTFIQQ